METALFYLQDSRSHVGVNIQWWAKGGNGYTTDIAKAEVYSREMALRIHEGRGTDIPWPKAYVDARTRPVVDMQYLEKGAAAATGEACFVQDNTRYSGNDVLWHTGNGRQLSSNLLDAVGFSIEAATALMASSTANIPWPVSYIQAKKRFAVDRHSVQLADALAGTGIVLKPQAKRRRERITCASCRRFLSEQQLWSGECPHCGTDSRP